MIWKKATAVAVVAAMMGTVGCQAPRKTEEQTTVLENPTGVNPEIVAATPTTLPTGENMKMPAELVKVEKGMLLGRSYFPTGEAGSSVVLLEKRVPAEVQAGKPFNYDIKVTNLTAMMLTGVVVNETVPGTFKIKDLSEGNSEGTANVVAIKVGEMEPGKSVILRLTGTAAQSGALPMCASVAYNTSLCMAPTVVSPALKLVAVGPASTMICDTLPYKLTVTNAGSGQAKNVKVESVLPEGLLTQEGKGAVAFNAGTLTAGESREFAFVAKASKTGKYKIKATAAADENLTSEAVAVDSSVTQPKLVVTKTGPDKGFIDRAIGYDISVTNDGDAPAKNTIIYDSLPENATVQGISNDGRVTKDNKVRWDVGEIPPKETRKVSVALSVSKSGEYTSGASAQATCAAPAAAVSKTVVTGIPAILIEVVDAPDPVRVGEQTTYTIEITNQGTAPGTGIKVVCTMEDPMDFIKATGDTKETVDAKTITFAPIANLAPKAKAVYKVTVRANKPGDVRFKTVMNSDQLGRPVEETEATNFVQ